MLILKKTAFAIAFCTFFPFSAFGQVTDLPEIDLNPLPFVEGILFDGTWEFDVDKSDLIGEGLIKVASSSFEKPGSLALRVKIGFEDHDGDSSTSIIIEIKHLDGETVEVVDASDFVGTEYWSETFQGDVAEVSVYSNSPDLDLLASIEYLHIPLSGGLGLEGQIDEDNRWHVNDYLKTFKETSLARTVARVENGIAKVEIGFMACTAFRVSDQDYVTNAHCFESEKQCKNTKLLLGFEQAVLGRHWTIFEGTVVSGLRHSERLKCKNLQIFPDHDMALITVDRTVDDKLWPILTFASAMPSSGPLISIQHPSGHRKRVTTTDCKIFNSRVKVNTGVGNKAFSHSCDSNKGSSGSPIFDINGAVVGLHFGGIGSANVAVRVEYVTRKLKDLGVI